MNKSIKKKVISLALVGMLLSILALGLYVCYVVMFDNTNKTPTSMYLFIKSGNTYEDVLAQLEKNKILKQPKLFHQVAQKMNYPNTIKPGRYRISQPSSNFDIISMLRSGKQEPVNLMIKSNIRTPAELVRLITRHLEVDSTEAITKLNDSSYLATLGYNVQNCLSIFIPNTYELYWNTSFDNLMLRMIKENEKFWQPRLGKLNEVGLTKQQIITLASIVEEETKIKTDKELVAGVYINRLRQDMRLQADPTVKYAVGDFSIKRVLFKHLDVESPYNTYKIKGLPPGPICIPTIESIDAVLNYKRHNYIFFCAKEDFSGYSNFAATLAEHEINRLKFITAMNERGIK